MKSVAAFGIGAQELSYPTWCVCLIFTSDWCLICTSPQPGSDSKTELDWEVMGWEEAASASQHCWTPSPGRRRGSQGPSQGT